MVDLVSKINQDILTENRINSLRNQKEEIRRRLQNPGLYPDPKATTLQQYTNEFRPASSTPLPVLAQMFNTGRQGIDSNSSSSVGGKDGVGGLGFGSGIAGLGGTLAGMAAGRAGMGPLSGVVSALASGMLGSRDPSKDIGLAFGKGLLGMAAPALMGKIGLATLVSGLMGKAFGFNPITEARSYLNVDNQFDLGYGYVPGMATKQGIDTDLEAAPGLETGQSFTGAFQGMMPEASYSDLEGGGTGLGGDPGPSGTGNSGNPGEG